MGHRFAVAATLLAVLAAGQAGCTVHKPLVRLSDVEVVRINTREMDLVFGLELVNLNTFGITLDQLSYELTGDGGVFASGDVAEPINIARQSTVQVPLPVTIRTSQLLASLQNARHGQACPYEFRGKGRFKIAGAPLGVDFVHVGQAPALRMPKVTLHGARVEQLAGEPALVLVLVVTNTNDFELPLAAIRGSLWKGQAEILQLQQTASGSLPPGEPVQVELPIRLTLSQVPSIVSALRDGSRLRFEGDLDFGSAGSVRSMLMGER